MKILTVGGGSGGHIAPVAATTEQLKRLAPEAELYFWCDKPRLKIAQQLFSGQTVKIDTIVAGKFRRYHQLSFWTHLRPSILVPNALDLFKFGIGLIQSWFKLLRLRPDVILAKGGFVCLPVGLAGHLLGVKIIIHDSDTVAGLTNRILARYATKIATGMPSEYYSYPTEKMVFVGNPVKQLPSSQKIHQRLNLSPDRPVVLVTGGGLGSQFLNQITIDALGLLRPDIQVVLITGEANWEDVNKVEKLRHISCLPFVPNLTDYMTVADVVVARAGANTIAELARLKRPTILVPNPNLTGGHQLKNAQMLASKDAVVLLEQSQLESGKISLADTVNQLLGDTQQLKKLARNISAFAVHDSAEKLAKLVLEQTRGE